MKLYELKENSEAIVKDLKGDPRFIEIWEIFGR